MTSNHIGQRLAFDGTLCTVRYIGPVIGTQKDWLGVEWDDPKRGKHDGEHQGKKYFTCRSKSKTVASFLRPSRVPDPSKSFVDAVTAKYATGIIESKGALAADLQKEIEISGKVAYEVGFDKIRMQQKQLHELKIVFVDAMRVSSAATSGNDSIQNVCPKIVELGLSRNLFENCVEIVKICESLKYLKSLVLNGNRVQISEEELVKTSAKEAFFGIHTLSLDEMLMTWEDVCKLSFHFGSLSSLSASLNELVTLPLIPGLSSMLPQLSSITLEYNKFTCLHEITSLASLPRLRKLNLKGNQISSITTSSDLYVKFGSNLSDLDLSYNAISSWFFVDSIPDAFPGLKNLRLSNNPVYTAAPALGSTSISADETYMLTLARLAGLEILNFSTISAAERTNAEMFYLSRIGKAIAAVPKGQEHKVTTQHRRYAELCEFYGEPVISRAEDAINPNFLEARLIKFNFSLAQEDGTKVEKIQAIPKSFDSYQLKGIVGKLFDLRPLSLRLVWETGEWDPMAGYDDQEDSEDDDTAMADDELEARNKGRWIKREVELEDGTRQIGNTIDATVAIVRVELR